MFVLKRFGFTAVGSEISDRLEYLHPFGKDVNGFRARGISFKSQLVGLLTLTCSHEARLSDIRCMETCS